MAISKLIIYEKIILGITLAAPIGPVSIEMIRRGLSKGFWSAFSIRLGGAVGNILCLLGACFGLSMLMGHPFIINTLGILGAIVLLYMGSVNFRKCSDNIELSGESKIKNGLIWGLYLAIVNPVAFVFWPGIFAASMQSIEVINLVEFINNLFIIVGVLLWGAGLSLLLAFGSNILNKTAINIITKLSALLMILFGFKYAYQVFLRIY